MKFSKYIKYCAKLACYYCFHRGKTAETMQKSPEKFEGLYQPVLLLSQNTGRKNSALKEWHIRSEKLFPDSALSKFCRMFDDKEYLEYFSVESAWILVKCFEKAGFIHDKPDENRHLTVNELQSYAYRALDGHEIEEGEQITVISPAWFYRDRIIEHGLSGEI